jgi:hypothetical protein
MRINKHIGVEKQMLFSYGWRCVSWQQKVTENQNAVDTNADQRQTCGAVLFLYSRQRNSKQRVTKIDCCGFEPTSKLKAKHFFEAIASLRRGWKLGIT